MIRPRCPWAVGVLLATLVGIVFIAVFAGAARARVAVDGRLDDLEAAVAIERAGSGAGHGSFATDDPFGDMYTQTCAFVNGFDIRRAVVYFESTNPDGSPAEHVTAYIGIRVEGMIGDTDGDGNADAFTPGSPGRASGCTLRDLGGIGDKEQYAVLVDSDCDGTSDFRVGVIDNQVVAFADSSSPPSAWPGTFRYDRDQLEIEVDEFEKLSPSGGPGCRLFFYASAAESGTGEDSTQEISVPTLPASWGSLKSRYR